MKQLLLLLILINGFLTSFAQSKSLSTIILDSIITDKSMFADSKPLKGAYKIDSLGQETFYPSEKFDSDKIKIDYRNIALIDTFGFFSEQYNTVPIKVYNKISKNANLNSSKLFSISGIATGRNNALAIAVLNLRSNFQTVYYFSIMGKEVKIIKKTSGSF